MVNKASMRRFTVLMATWMMVSLAVESIATAQQCEEGDEYCVPDDVLGGRSMLNLKMQSKAVANVDEHKQRLMGTDSLTGAELTNHSTPLSQITELRALIAKPTTSGLPGDVVITTLTIKCGDQVFAPLGKCPEACPFFTSISGKSCFFKCVPADKCGSEAAVEKVPDNETGVCRECNTQGCKTCSDDPEDKCKVCNKGYRLQDDGSCASDYAKVWKYIIIFVSVMMGFLVIWMIQLACAPITNRDGLREGLDHRSSVKLHIPVKDTGALDPSEDRELFPISTNLHVTQVAGPGLTLHMNFQMAAIMWGNTLIVCWLFFVYLTDARQLTIGLFPADTAPQLCYVTLQGRSLQEEQMPFKVTFIAITYVITFAFCIGYAIFNDRVFANIEDATGMEDFVALLTGLPPVKGSDPNVEADLKECLQTNTGEDIVGVSLTWNYSDKAEDVQDILEKDMLSREPYAQPEPDPNVFDSRSSAQKKIFDPVDNFLGGVLGLTIPEDGDDDSIDQQAVVEMLEEMTTASSAFVVFETSEARDRAVQTMRSKDVVAFKGGMIKLNHKFCEPKIILWENFNVDSGQLVTRVLLGVVGILIALVVYSVCFYLPFAYYQSMFKFPNEPGAVEGIIFSMLVVAGNQIMYQICSAISEGAGFHFRDDAEALYVSLYVLAVLLSVFFDMSVESFLGYHSMADAGVKTADGRSLDEIDSYQQIFESYPMQKVLGKRLFDYCFPATFTIPFIVEPIGTITAPFMVQKWLLRTHPEVRGRNAEKSIDFFAPFDMGRYGDILLNIWLVTLLLFFPSGSILPILLTYVVSAFYVYCYDQYRILRCCPSFDYGTDTVDKYTQLMMILPCSTLASVFVFKANCLTEGFFCYSGYDVAVNMGIAFLVHTIVHLVLLKTIVPLIASMHEDAKVEETYTEVATKDPCNWFNANPVQCLRSKFIHQDSPSLCFWVQGKEHLIKKNPKIGQYFENSKKTKSEFFDE